MKHERHHHHKEEGHHNHDKHHEHNEHKGLCGASHGHHMYAHMHHRKMRGALIVATTLLSFFLLSLIVTEVRGWSYIGSGIQPTNTISVQGEGEVFAVPDTATFSFSVIKEGNTAEVVQSEAAEVANAAVAYLKENGVDEKDIKTTSYNVYPRYEHNKVVCVTFPCPQGERELVGFEINQRTQAKIRNTQIAGELLSGVGAFGVENISGLSFTIDDEDELKREARQVALADAKEKAKALADDLGVQLVRVVNFNESDGGYYRGFEFAVSDAAIGGELKGAPEIELGENRITSNVNITYEIR